MRIGLLVLAGFVGLGYPLTADSPNRVATLISLLGSDDFAQREKASTQLRQLGSPVLPRLRAYYNHSDPEIRLRVARLVRAIEVRDEQVELLETRRFSLSYRDQPLDEVLADLQTKTGFKLRWAKNAPDPKKIRIRLHANNVSAWEALELLRDHGVEEEPTEVNPQSDTSGTIVLRPSTSRKVPTAINGPFRIRALPSGVGWPRWLHSEFGRGLPMVVRCDPSMNLERVVDLRIHEIRSVSGRPLLSSYVPEHSAFDLNEDILVKRINLLVQPATEPPPAKPFFPGLHVRLGSTPCRTLAKVRGSLLVTVRTPIQPLVEVQPNRTQLNQHRPCRDGGSLRITERKQDADGFWNYRVTVTEGAEPKPELEVQGCKIVLHRVKVGTSLLDRNDVPFRLLDADGKPIRFATGDSTSVGDRRTQVYKLSFLPKPGQTPTKLIYSSRRTTTLEVPFVLTDVPLD